jgi:hypothetical protein
LLDAEKSLRGRALKEGAGLRVNGSAKEVVRCSVTNIEMDGSIERGQFHEIKLAKRAFFLRWRGGKSVPAEYANWLYWFY